MPVVNNIVVFTLHGVNGHHTDLGTVKEVFEDKSQNITIVPIEAYNGRTRKGIIDCATLAADTVEKHMKDYMNMGIVAHSFGGVIARHMLYILNSRGVLEGKCLEFFVTFATPHAGCREFVSFAADWVAPVYCGKAGSELTVQDSSAAFEDVLVADLKHNDASSGLPLLPHIAASKSILALTSRGHLAILGKFKRRIMLSNVWGDFQVQPKTSLAVPLTLPLPEGLTTHFEEAYAKPRTYIKVDPENCKVDASIDVLESKTHIATTTPKADQIADLAAFRLNTLTWERRVAYFKSLMSHVNIVGHCGRPGARARGLEVVRAVVDDVLDQLPVEYRK